MAADPAAKKAAPKRKKKQKLGKPPALLYYPALALVSLFYRLKYGMTVERAPIRAVKGPCFVLAPHLSNKDHILTATALWPRRPTYVLSEHFRTTRLMRFVCRLMHTVSKKMFCSDARAVMGIIRAVKEGNTVVLFPEGRLSWYGRSLAVTEGTAQLVKQLGVPVLTVTSNGAGRTFPKWAKCQRRGKIQIETAVLLTAEQIAAMTVEEIETAVAGAILHDEEKVLPEVRFKTKDTTLGLDGILWRCPACGGEYTLNTEGDHVRCTSCGFDVALDEYGKFSANEALQKEKIGSVADWYEYCAGLLDMTQPLTLDVQVSGTDAEGYMQQGIGAGKFTVSREGFAFEGTLDGKADSFFIPLAKVAGFPVTVGDHVDIYRDGRLLWLQPKPDGRKAILLVAYLENLKN